MSFGTMEDLRVEMFEPVVAVEKRARQPMSSMEREQHIQDCGRLMLEAYGRYERSGCLADLGEAHRFRMLMEQGIQMREAAQIERMESERGLV